MPHSTLTGSEHRPSSASARAAPHFKSSTEPREGTEPFPLHNDAVFLEESSRTPSPHVANGIISGPPSGERWQMHNEKPDRTYWSSKKPSISIRSHGRQKSIGDAFRTIRTRKGSVSANAHELADALKAPVSPMLIVCRSTRGYDIVMLIAVVDIVYCVVLLFRSYEHIFEIHSQRISQTSYAYTHTIRFRVHLLSALFLVGIYVSGPQKKHSSIAIWNQISRSRGPEDYSSFGRLSDRGSFA